MVFVRTASGLPRIAPSAADPPLRRPLSDFEHPRPGRGDLTLSGFVAGALVAVGLLCAAWWLSLQQTRAAEWVSHTHEVLTTIARTRGALLDIQNGHRGFTISGQEEDLAPYTNGRAVLDTDLRELGRLVADNPIQLRHLADLKVALGPRLASAEELVAARRRGGFAAAKSIVDTGLPNAQMERLRGVLRELEGEEQRLLGQRLDDQRRRGEWFLAGTAAVVLGLLGALAVLYQQVRRRRDEHQLLLETEQRFHLMTDSVVDYAIIMLDPQGCVRTWNMGAQRITGHAEAAIVGRDFACFYAADEIAIDLPTRTLQVAAAQRRVAEESRLVRADGSAFWASVVMTSLRDRAGGLRGFCMIARDLTERRRAQEALVAEMQERLRIDEELQRLNQSLEELVRARTAELRAANDDLLAAKLRLHDLSSQLITAQEQERRHIARELHDETGQSLTVIRMHLMDMLRGAAGAAARLPDCLAVVDAAIVQIRGMALNLRPTMLDDLGLPDALQWALDQQSKAAGWTTAFESDGEFWDVPGDTQTACFRIGQEALTNAARHANATDVSLELRTVGEMLELTVCDNGGGFDVARYSAADERRKHFGLISMAERAGLIGGRLEIDSVPGQGTRVRAMLPLPAAAVRRRTGEAHAALSG
jgi:PAS domain S-box-containing protein